MLCTALTPVGSAPANPLSLGFRKVAAQCVKKDSEFRIDPEKARESLKQLDDQLRALSQKQYTPPAPPKLADSELEERLGGDDNKEEAAFSGPVLPYLFSGLLFFTIFYNVIFNTVIKPGIDGP